MAADAYFDATKASESEAQQLTDIIYGALDRAEVAEWEAAEHEAEDEAMARDIAASSSQ